MSMRWTGGIGLIVLIACAVGAGFDTVDAVRGWLVAALFWIGIPIGALPLVMGARLSHNVWYRAASPTLHASLYTLPLLLLAFVPLAIWAQTLFPWAAPAQTLSETVRSKLPYLNLPFFWGRTGGYFLVWMLFSWALLARLGAGLAAFGLLWWGMTVTFFAFDWIMSLQPEFFAGSFGVLIMAGYVVMGLAVAVLGASRRGDASVVLGNMLLVAAVFWAFMNFSQYLVVWSANLPHQASWYQYRTDNGWEWVMTGLLLYHLLIPAPVLLSGHRWRRACLRFAAGSLLVAQGAQMLWLVVPTFHDAGWPIAAFIPASVVALGGLWLALFSYGIERQPARIADVEETGCRRSGHG